MNLVSAMEEVGLYYPMVINMMDNTEGVDDTEGVYMYLQMALDILEIIVVVR